MCFEQDHVAVPGELDLVEEEDQITHLLRLEEAANAEDILSKSKVFSMETLIFTCYRLMLISLVMSFIWFFYFQQISSNLTQISWRTRRNTRKSKEVCKW